jgi:hypothetical protein
MDTKAFIAKLTDRAKRLPAKMSKAAAQKAALRQAVIEARPAIALLLEKRYTPAEIARLMTETAGDSGFKFTSRLLAETLPDVLAAPAPGRAPATGAGGASAR